MLCVLAKLDADSTEKLNALRRAVGGKKPLYGHITAATYTGDAQKQFIESCKERFTDLPAFSVCFAKLAVLEETSILAALPERSAALDALHGKIAETFSAELDEWTRSDRWLPHTTLLYDPAANLQRLCEFLRERFAPINARIEQIVFSRVCETGYSIVDTINLIREE